MFVTLVITISLCIVFNQNDIYTRLEVLEDSLHAWSLNPPSQKDTLADDWTLSSLFPQATLLPQFPDGPTKVVLPPLVELLTTELNYYVRTKLNGSPGQRWDLEAYFGERVLILDGKEYPYPIEIGRSDVLKSYIWDRLVGLRTCGLPTDLRASSMMWSDSVSLRLHGRELTEYRFSREAWRLTRDYLAFGMLVYAGIIQLTATDNEFVLEFYLLLTMPDTEEYHLFLITDRFSRTDIPVCLSDIKNKLNLGITGVDFIPFIRTDNLRSWFSDK